MHGEHSNSTKYAYVIIFLTIQINYIQVNTITLWFTISVKEAKTNSHNRMCDTWRQRCLLPWTTELHPGIRSTELTKLIETCGIICCFLLPNTLKISQHWGMNKLLFRVACLAMPFNLLTTSVLYSKCPCSLESLGGITKWISQL